MEKEASSKLPPIFKMTVLCNILPYYGHLHRWRWLLEKINKKTCDIWRQNREALTYLGKDFRREITIDWENCSVVKVIIANLNKNWLDLFLLSSSSYLISYCPNDFSVFIDKITQDDVVIIKFHADQFKDFQISYWSKENVANILPAVSCPSFKPEVKFFKGSEIKSMLDFFINESCTKSIVIDKNNEDLSVYLVNSQTLKLLPRMIFDNVRLKSCFKLEEQNKLWKINDWVCKPKRLIAWTYSIFLLCRVVDELSAFNEIKDVQIGFRSEVNDIMRLYYYSIGLKFRILFDFKSERINENFSDFVFSGKSITIACRGKTLTLSFKNSIENLRKFEILGSEIIYNNRESFFALKYTISFNLMMTLVNEDKSTSDKLDFIKYMKEITKSEHQIYVIFDKKDLTLKTSFNKISNDISSLDLWSNVDLKMNTDSEESDVVDMLELIPKHLVCRLKSDNLNQIVSLMKSKSLIEKFEEIEVKILFKGIEIKPKILDTEEKEENFIKEIKLKEQKEERLGMSYK